MQIQNTGTQVRIRIRIQDRTYSTPRTKYAYAPGTGGAPGRPTSHTRMSKAGMALSYKSSVCSASAAQKVGTGTGVVAVSSLPRRLSTSSSSQLVERAGGRRAARRGGVVGQVQLFGAFVTLHWSQHPPSAICQTRILLHLVPPDKTAISISALTRRQPTWPGLCRSGSTLPSQHAGSVRQRARASGFAPPTAQWKAPPMNQRALLNYPEARRASIARLT